MAGGEGGGGGAEGVCETYVIERENTGKYSKLFVLILLV